LASGEKISIVAIGHASLLFLSQSNYIYVDPWSNLCDYSKFSKAVASQAAASRCPPAAGS
jgi:hypothetical protein